MEKVKRGFKQKTIEQNIREKIKGWLASIEDIELRDEIRDHYIVTGGAITSMLLGDLPNDYDIYIDNTDTAAKLANYYVSRLSTPDNEKTQIPIVSVPHGGGRVEIKVKSAGIAGEDVDQSQYDYFEMYPDASNKMAQYLDGAMQKNTGRYSALAITTNAITLSDQVQIILRFVGPAEEIHKNYDFVHTTNYFTEKTGVVFNQPALESILARELRYVGSLYPICSIFRIKKFIQRGWTITAGEMLKISWDISKLDLTDVNVLQDQLTGVDAAYFNQIIRLLKEDDKPIDRTYLFELVNRIFDEEWEDEPRTRQDQTFTTSPPEGSVHLQAD